MAAVCLSSRSVGGCSTAAMQPAISSKFFRMFKLFPSLALFCPPSELGWKEELATPPAHQIWKGAAEGQRGEGLAGQLRAVQHIWRGTPTLTAQLSQRHHPCGGAHHSQHRHLSTPISLSPLTLHPSSRTSFTPHARPHRHAQTGGAPQRCRESRGESRRGACRG